MKERQLEKVKDATSYAVAAQERVRETGMQTQRDRDRETEGERERERREEETTIDLSTGRSINHSPCS